MKTDFAPRKPHPDQTLRLSRRDAIRAPAETAAFFLWSASPATSETAFQPPLQV